MKIAYLDCFSGISGNMMLGALVDAGVDVAQLEAELARLALTGYTISARQVQRHGLQGTYVEVETAKTQNARHLQDIQTLIQKSDLPQTVKRQSIAIFERMAAAEARVHGIPVEAVHFHEVGAVDAIVDVVGSAIGLWLLGVEMVYASPVHVGRGRLECAHGTLPVPAPATQELLKGVPIYGRDVDLELVTPTGAAILTGLAQSYGNAPPMRVTHIGYGAGSRNLPCPNLVRLCIGETSDPVPLYEEDAVTLLEANIDDMNPQWYEHVMARLFAAGALDVFLTPIQMKRGRPAVQLSVLVAPEGIGRILPVIFAETSTIGIRTSLMRRWKLTRERVVVETPYGPVGVKVARQGARALNIQPEYRECLQIAQQRGIPLKEVSQVVLEAARAHLAAQE